MEIGHSPEHTDEAEQLSLPATQTQTQTQASDETMTQSQDVNTYWARLVPQNPPNLASLNLVNDKYTAGRGPDNDIVFSVDNVKLPNLCVISKLHFTIEKKMINDKDVCVVFLLDHSHNGTFVNKKLVGKGKQVLLENKDRIAIGKPQFTVFQFTDFNLYTSTNLPRELSSRYIVLRKLGAGAAGEVDMIFSKSSFNTFAMKAIAKMKMTMKGNPSPLNDPEKIENEVNILRKLKHPCIIKMEDIIDTPQKVYIVLELMEGGELFDRISENGGLEERVTKFMFLQICHAVDYLHRNGITHRDLKPENILLASDDQYPLVKVSDFGMSKFVDAESMMKTFCGTPLYVAPEILKTYGKGAYTSQVDVWSLGVILYVMLSGLCPFNQANKEFSLSQQILRGIWRFPMQKFGKVSHEAKELIKSMMTVNPERRSNIRRVLLHNWLIKDTEVKRAVNKVMYGGGAVTENTPPNESARQTHRQERSANHVFDVPGSKPKRARLG